MSLHVAAQCDQCMKWEGTWDNDHLPHTQHPPEGWVERWGWLGPGASRRPTFRRTFCSAACLAAWEQAQDRREQR